MKLKSIIAGTLIITGLFLFTACGGGVDKDAKPYDVEELTKNQPETHGTEIKKGAAVDSSVGLAGKIVSLKKPKPVRLKNPVRPATADKPAGGLRRGLPACRQTGGRLLRVVQLHGNRFLARPS